MKTHAIFPVFERMAVTAITASAHDIIPDPQSCKETGGSRPLGDIAYRTDASLKPEGYRLSVTPEAITDRMITRS